MGIGRVWNAAVVGTVSVIAMVFVLAPSVLLSAGRITVPHPPQSGHLKLASASAPVTTSMSATARIDEPTDFYGDVAHEVEIVPDVLGWRPTAAMSYPSRHANQGVTTTMATGGPAVLTRGDADIPPALFHDGWVHVGDPDSHLGYVVDAYQARPGALSKLFVVTAPNGRVTRLVHPLETGEGFNNSFVSVSPDGRWLVSAEWNVIRRLLVFRLPTLSPTMGSHTVPLQSTINLSHALRNVQGCDFSSATAMVCSTNDPDQGLFPVSRQLISIRLERVIDGRPVAGEVSLMGRVPRPTSCAGDGETEGLDVTGDTLRLAVVEPAPCRTSTRLYTYTVTPRRLRSRSTDD
ncbi:MAG: hypothetical protein JWM76_1077 [Pseudonocardiales bacterium]|nr:hypothetical protein [Pseudonocardiales bacterium]